tara:strand:- start:77 stop:256 length:180 start_codon:yes stop_codon:yes gene_type:complete
MSLSKRVLTITEFIDAYGIGRTKLYELIKNNEIAVKKFGRKTLIPIDEAERWLESLPNA